LQSWQSYSLTANPRYFRPIADGQVAMLAADAVSRAIKSGTDVTIGWGAADLWTTPADGIEETFRQLQPATLVLSERPGKPDGRWVIQTAGVPASIPAAAVQQAVNDHVSTTYPQWRHGLAWSGSAFLLRHSVSAEELGIVSPHKPSADEIVASVADCPDVLAANRRDDLHRLAAARLAAQAALGIPEDDARARARAAVQGFAPQIGIGFGRVGVADEIDAGGTRPVKVGCVLGDVRGLLLQIDHRVAEIHHQSGWGG
jgi:hypothetical protein